MLCFEAYICVHRISTSKHRYDKNYFYLHPWLIYIYIYILLYVCMSLFLLFFFFLTFSLFMFLCICLPQKALSKMAAVNSDSGEGEGSGPIFLSTVKLPLFYMICVFSSLGDCAWHCLPHLLHSFQKQKVSMQYRMCAIKRSLHILIQVCVTCAFSCIILPTFYGD